MSIDELIAKMHAAEDEYLAGGYSAGVCARLRAVEEARHAVWTAACSAYIQDVVFDMFADHIDLACGIVRSDN